MLADKGIREMVWAARELARHRIHARIWLVGDPDPDNPTSLTKADLTAWHAEGCVEWLGQQNDIRSIWQQAHVCVLPSYREGLPKALLEAAASGRPIITTDVPGCREVVRDGVDGLLIPMNDWCALAEAIARLAGDSELRHRMGANARARAEAEFGSVAIISQISELYAEALETVQ
jgi:glycosyltransferase involved in cell wall biosynthesis